MEQLGDKVSFVQTVLFLHRFLFLLFLSVTLCYARPSATALNRSPMFQITVCCDLTRAWLVKERVCQLFESFSTIVCRLKAAFISFVYFGSLECVRHSHESMCDSNGSVCDTVTRVRFVTHSREFATWGRRSQAPSTLRLRIFWKRIKRFPSTLRRKHLTTRQIHRQCILDLCPRKNWTGIITWLLWHHHCRKTTFSKCFRPVLKLITQQERYHFDLIPLIVL